MTFYGSHGLLVLAALGLVACGGSSDSSEQNAEPAPLAEETASQVAEQTAAPTPAEPAGPAPEFASLPEPYQTADYNKGRRLFRQCSSCHLLDEGGGNLVGPNLYGLFGRQAGAVDGFKYSAALSEADFTWTPEQLDQWLASPKEFLPGNRMVFNGIRRDVDRQAVIAYVMANTGWSE